MSENPADWWETTTDIMKMLSALFSTNGWRTQNCMRPTERQLRLFMVASARLCWEMRLLDRNWGPRIIDVAERAADGLASADEIQTVSQHAGDITCWLLLPYGHTIENCTQRFVHELWRRIIPGMARTLREILGNPFRPALVGWGQWVWLNDDGNVVPRGGKAAPWLCWPGPIPALITRLAQGIYDSADWADVPVLADAVEDAGLDARKTKSGWRSPLLEHLRSPGPHVRGCWGVDLILEKV